MSTRRRPALSMNTRSRQQRIRSAPPQIGQSFVLFVLTKRKTALFHKAVIICHHHRAPSQGGIIPLYVDARNFGTLTSAVPGHRAPAVAGQRAPAETSVEKNARTAQNQEKCKKKEDALTARYQSAKKQLEAVNYEKQSRLAKRDSIRQFILELGSGGGSLAEFDEPLWYATVDTVTVGEKTAVFTFKDGTVIETNL